MATIGLFSNNCQQELITSCARRSISGLARCTESKSKASALLLEPEEMLEAAPPPIPMSIPGPPNCMSKAPTGI